MPQRDVGDGSSDLFPFRRLDCGCEAITLNGARALLFTRSSRQQTSSCHASRVRDFETICMVRTIYAR